MASTPLKYGAAGLPSSRFARGMRTRSHESLNSLALSVHVSIDLASVPSKVAKQVVPTLPTTEGKARPVSRLELLLDSRTSKPVFTPEGNTADSQSTNRAIEMSAQWTDVQDAVLNAPVLTFNNLAYAVYRLGCLAAFDSKKRRNDLYASNVIPQIFEMAMAKIDSMDPSSLTLLLDGCARLHHKPSLGNLAKIAALIRQNAATLDARQLSLVLWAFSALEYKPGSQTLMVLEAAICAKARDLPPQGVALVLTSFQAAQHGLSQMTLSRLADVVQRKLLLFKPSELANSLKALAAAGFNPTMEFIEALKQVTGRSQNAASQGLGTGYNLSLAS